MNILADDRISETRDFTTQFVLFPTPFGPENRGKGQVARLSRDQMDAFLGAESHNARSAHFFVPTPEPPAATPEKGLAAGVLKQTAHDLRRFRDSTKGVKRELYLDAYSWITGQTAPAVFPGNCSPLLFAFPQAVIWRQPRPANWLHVFERI